MSSRGNKNFRRRTEDDGDGEEKSPVVPSSSTKNAPNQSRPKPRPSKLLSFADEEEEEGLSPVRATTRSSSSSVKARPYSIHKVTSSKDRAASGSPSLPIPSNVQPQTGEYTVERLRELRKNTRPIGGVAKSSSQLSLSSTTVLEPSKLPKGEVPAEPKIVLKGLVKPAAMQQKQGDELEPEEEEEEEEVNGHMFSKLGINVKGKESSGIPDQAYINAIKAKKEQKRQLGVALPDYISLDGGGVPSARACNGGSSDEEESDFRGRMSLFGDVKDAGSKKGVFEAVMETKVLEGRMDDEDDDDEERRWEEEQYRKALGKRLDDSSAAHVVPGAVVAILPSINPQTPVYPHQDMFSSDSLGSSFGVSRSAEVLSISQQAEIAKRALQDNISRLKDSHSRTLSSLVKTEDNLSEALSNITHLEKSLEDAGKKFMYMQELRSFILVMCDFLQDKAPYIEELEEHMQKLHEERSLTVIERRITSIDDETTAVEDAVNAAMSVLSKGSGSAYISAAATAAQAASAASRESSNLPVQLDEFGRDLNLQKRTDSARRAEMRKRRKERSEAKRIVNGGDDTCYLIEGECSTDESDSESKAYQSNQDELLQTSEQIFSDAADEFANLSVVKYRFEEWKKRYPSSYRDAYMALSSPDIFSPYVRLELLKWDPLYKDIDFNDMKWHTELFTYGFAASGDDIDPNDADANLIPELVEKVALPILYHDIERCWDILSTTRTRNAVSATKLIINYIPSSSKGLRDLLSVVRTRLIEAVKNLIVPTWSTTVIKVVPDAAHITAYRFGMAVRLLRNICLWKNILAVHVLEEIALDQLLIGKVLPHLYSITPNIHDAITRTERVVASLSGVWSGPKGENHPKLQLLVSYVTELGRKLEKRHASGAVGDITSLARRLKKMMVDLNEYDKARAILKTFQIREAL